MEPTNQALIWALWLTYCFASGWYAGLYVQKRGYPIWTALAVVPFNMVLVLFLPL